MFSSGGNFPSDQETEKMRSLRSMMHTDRPHSIALALADRHTDDHHEATRSMRSFTVRSDAQPAPASTHAQPDNDENPRSLRSCIVRSERRSTLTGAPAAAFGGDDSVAENPRSLRSVTVRHHNSTVGSDTSSETEEHPRSEGTLRSDSPASRVLAPEEHESDENPRSMRSVTVHRS